MEFVAYGCCVLKAWDRREVSMEIITIVLITRETRTAGVGGEEEEGGEGGAGEGGGVGVGIGGIEAGAVGGGGIVISSRWRIMGL